MLRRNLLKTISCGITALFVPKSLIVGELNQKLCIIKPECWFAFPVSEKDFEDAFWARVSS